MRVLATEDGMDMSLGFRNVKDHRRACGAIGRMALFVLGLGQPSMTLAASLWSETARVAGATETPVHFLRAITSPTNSNSNVGHALVHRSQSELKSKVSSSRPRVISYVSRKDGLLLLAFTQNSNEVEVIEYKNGKFVPHLIEFPGVSDFE